MENVDQMHLAPEVHNAEDLIEEQPPVAIHLPQPEPNHPQVDNILIDPKLYPDL